MPAARFTKAEFKRAVEAAQASGLIVSAVEITPDGTIKIQCPVDEKIESDQDQRPKEW